MGLVKKGAKNYQMQRFILAFGFVLGYNNRWFAKSSKPQLRQHYMKKD